MAESGITSVQHVASPIAVDTEVRVFKCPL